MQENSIKSSNGNTNKKMYEKFFTRPAEPGWCHGGSRKRVAYYICCFRMKSTRTEAQ